MKSIAVTISTVAVLAFLVNGAMARTTDEDTPYQGYQAVSSEAVSTTEIHKATSFRPHLPKLVLPNIDRLARQLQTADRSKLQPQLIASQRVIRFWNNKGRWLRAPRHEKCWEVPWQRSCTVARASYRLHTKLAAVAEYRLIHELPNINDWKTAVRFVQKIYPGTESWMLYISDREGGWGQWVWYGGRGWSGYHVGNDFLGADTVGGWMQFRYSTFAPYWRATEENLRERGFIIPDFQMPPAGGDAKYAAWLSPLGQALTAGYMRWSHQDSCHWCL